MNTSHIPTPQDEELRLEESITKTATFDGTTKDLGLRYAPGGLGQQAAAVVQVSAMDTESTDETYKMVLQESADGETWTDAGPIISVTEVGAISIPGWISKQYARVKLDVGGTTPSITYEAWLNFNL
ncbi:MAG: hypothetical protein ACM359_16525 [Bacillota bacterium]